MKTTSVARKKPAAARTLKGDSDAVRDRLIAAQSQLHRSRHCAVAVILTGVPTAGRSEAVNTLLEWMDPKHISVHALNGKDPAGKGRPSLWPYWMRVPPRGRIALFFDGWYERPLYDAVRRPKKAQAHEARRVERIRQFEAMLVRDGVRVVKVHFHVDQVEQQRRMKTLLSDALTAGRVTRTDRWQAAHYGRVHEAWRHWHELTEQPPAPWHRIDSGDADSRAVQLGRLLLEAIEAAPQAMTVSAPAAVTNAPALPPPAPAEVDDEDYERELPQLQTALALAVRKKKFRKRGLVLAFEGMDAAGKGGAIRRITHALDARQYTVLPVSAPTPEELAHPYLWRFWRDAPRRGGIAIFDRSWYGRVLVERVRDLAADADWQRAYEEIREFERQLHESGFVIRKFWLSVGEDEQLKRLKAREADSLKRFKVDPQDWADRRHHAEYQRAASEMMARTHAEHAPWVAVAADDKKAARLAVLREVVGAVEEI